MVFTVHNIKLSYNITYPVNGVKEMVSSLIPTNESYATKVLLLLQLHIAESRF